MAYTPTFWRNDMPPDLDAWHLNRLTAELIAQAAALSISHTLPTWVDNSTPALTDPVGLNEMERVCGLIATALGLTYTQTVWQAGWTPPRNAPNLQNLENQVATNSLSIIGSPSIPTPVESGWTRVLETTFTQDGVLPYPWGTYGPYASGSNPLGKWGYWLPSQVEVSGGVCRLKHSYLASGPGTLAPLFGAGGSGWYQGTIYAKDAGTQPWGQVNARVSFRMRVVSTFDVIGHRNLPLRWGYPNQPPGDTGVRGTSGDGEEDWMEDNGSFTGHVCFIHWYLNGEYRDPPLGTGVGSVSKTWPTLDNRNWHTYKIQRVGQTISGFVDGAATPAMTITPTEYQMPPTARRTIVFQHNNVNPVDAANGNWSGSIYAGAGYNTAGYEHIEIDWVAVDIPVV